MGVSMHNIWCMSSKNDSLTPDWVGPVQCTTPNIQSSWDPPEVSHIWTTSLLLSFSVPRFKQRFSFITPEFGNLYAILDAAKVADILMFVLSPELGIDEWGEYCLSSLFAQGLPACLHIVQVRW